MGNIYKIADLEIYVNCINPRIAKKVVTTPLTFSLDFWVNDILLVPGFSVLTPWAFIRFCEIKPAESEAPNKCAGVYLVLVYFPFKRP